jgi:hypothetical protein
LSRAETQGLQGAPSRGGGRILRGLAWIAGFALACGLFDFLAGRLAAVTDDAFISFRYAQHLAAGEGLVYNPGSRVEGYTNFLWTLLMAVGAGLGLELSSLAARVGIVCAAGLVLAMLQFSRRQFRDAPFPGVHALGAALVVLNPFFVQYVGNGLETSFYTLLLFLGFASYEAQRRSAGSAARTGVLLGLAYLTRPDALLWAAGYVAADGIDLVRGSAERRRSLIRIAAYCGVLGAIVALHLLWRVSYYGDWLPNTFHAKSGANWFWGVMKLPTLVRATGGVVVLALVATPLLLRRRWVLAPWLICLGFLALFLRTGGLRYAVPALPLVYLFVQELVRLGLSWASDRSCRIPLRGLAAAATALLIALHVLGAVHHWPNAARNRGSTLSMSAGAAQVGRCLKERTAPTDTIAVFTAGALPYYAERPVIDMLGLNDRHIAKRGRRHALSFPGHQRSDSDYVLDQAPRIILAPRKAGGGALGNVAAVGELSENPRLEELYEPTSIRCGGRVRHFFVRRGDPLAAPPEASRRTAP